MRRLGHERFAVVGHDRGSYVAMRAALDHPDAVTHLAVLDCIPIVEHLERADDRFATAWCTGPSSPTARTLASGPLQEPPPGTAPTPRARSR